MRNSFLRRVLVKWHHSKLRNLLRNLLALNHQGRPKKSLLPNLVGALPKPPSQPQRKMSRSLRLRRRYAYKQKLFCSLVMSRHKMVSLGTTIRLLPCDLEVTSSNIGNSLSTYRGKTMYIYSLQTPPGGSLTHWPLFLVMSHHNIHAWNLYTIRPCSICAID